MPAKRGGLDRYHGLLLEQLSGTFEVDRTERQKRLSAGMKIATFLGAVTLAAALYTFLYRFWGGMPFALQAGTVAATPLLLVTGMEIAARREKTLYVTLLLGLLAGTSFVIGLPVMAGLLNVALPPAALLGWAGFCAALAYAYGLRLLLVVAILLGLGFVGTLAGPTGPCVWEAFGHRPEAFLPAGFLLFAIPRVAPHREFAGFPAAWRTLGLLALFLPILILGRAGNASFLGLGPGTIEAGYQLLGFVLAALAVWLGVRSAWPEVTNVGGGAFVVFLYVKLYDWWWAFLPRWVSRLHPVDAALDARALRARHPDRQHVLIVRAVVTAESYSRWDPETRTSSPPFLRGRIQRLLVEEIQVPRGNRALLDALASGEAIPAGAGATSSAATASGRFSAEIPRYRVVLRTGDRLEPWVAELTPHS